MKKESSKVVAVRATYEDIFENINRAISYLGPLALTSGKNVLIKVNLCDVRTPETGTITHPLFLDGTLRYLRENYEDLKIYVAESDATVVLADEFLKWLGFVPVLEKWDAQYVNLAKTAVVKKKINGRYFKEFPMPEIFEKTDFFITIPKPKTNLMSTITCCLKNQFGCLPTVTKNIYHPYLDDVIADVNTVMHPDLCLVDGIIAMGSAQGPSNGIPIPLKAIICSLDPVAADAYCARIMGFNPRLIGHIRKSAAAGVGSMKYQLCGDKIDKIDFEISKVEMWLLNLAGSLQRRGQKKFRAEG